MVKKFRKKPIIVKAMKIVATDEAMEKLIYWMGKSFEGSCYNVGMKTASVFINTLEGTMTAKEGDYIIKGIKGEFYSCRGDIFKKSYEEVK